MKLSSDVKLKYKNYVNGAKEARENLEFILDNIGHSIDLDFSHKSIVELEKFFWLSLECDLFKEITDSDHFIHLVGQYVGESIISITGSKWVQSNESNSTFGQPCIDGFGGKIWDRFYPVNTANNLKDLPTKKPDFPGVKERAVFALKFRNCLTIYERSKMRSVSLQLIQAQPKSRL